MDITQKQQAYQRFFETHVNPGVTEGLLDLVPASFLGQKNTDLLASITDNKGAVPAATVRTIRDHYDLISAFAKEFGAENLTFTKQGTWVIPPLLRNEFPAYKEYLLESKDIVGTGAITLAQNEAIPTFENGEQQGGFETGDQHGYLTIVDGRTGKVYELQQSFLEDSDDAAMRPAIVSVNYEAGKRILKNILGREATNADVDAFISSSDRELDSTGMLGGLGENSAHRRQTGLASYACELVRDPDAAFNWNDGRLGANFNYVPIAAIEFGLNAQQLDVLLFDRELAARECEIKAAEGISARQNEKGYEPGTRESFYPNGEPRYATSETQVIDGENVVIFKNASADTPGAFRVMEYDTVVRPEDMQVTLPYNHWGASAGGFKGTQNCFGSVCDLLEGVAAHGSTDKGLLETLGGRSLRSSGITRTVFTLLGNAENMETKTVEGPVSGEVAVYETPLETGRKVKVIDFADLPGAAAQKMQGVEEPELGGIAGEAIRRTTQQRQEAVTKGDRAPDAELTIFPTGSAGNYLAQCHERETPVQVASEHQAKAVKAAAALRHFTGGGRA